MADGTVVIEVTADDKEAQKRLNELRRSIEKTEKAIESTSGKKAAITEQLEQARKEAEATSKEIEALTAQKLENDAALSGQAGDVDLEEFEARKQAQAEIAYQLKEQQKAQAAQEATITKLTAKEQKLTAQLEQQTAQLDQQKTNAGEVQRVIAAQASSAMPRLAEVTEAASQAMRKGVKSILRWGLGIRSAFILIRRLRSAVIEGVKAFAQQDEETRNNINGLKASLSTLKASWGAAFAPIFNAVVPILQKLISWLTAAANAIAMFFSALTGKSTYKKAIANNGALADSYGAAGAAAKKAEGQIMGFDEINKLNANDDNSGGGGGTGGAAEQMFEEIPILESFKKHLDDILIIVGLIGAALLAWKLAPLLGISFQKLFGILVALIGLIELVHGGLNAWNEGVNMDNLFDMLKGAALLVGGLALAFGATGAAIGLLISGIALLVVGLHDWIATGELSTEAFYALELGILSVGGALAILLGWPALIVAAIVALALAIYKNWDEIKEKCKAFFDELKNLWNEFKTKLASSLNEFGAAAKKSFSETWENMKNAASSAWESMKNTIKGYIDKIKNLLNFQWSFPKPKMPHFTWWWESVGGLLSIPRFSIDWYAKGGIVDGATLIGAGEAGKEAIVPLERNTGWINMVADGIFDRLMSNRGLADFISGRALPAVAIGEVIPPNSTNGGNTITKNDLARLLEDSKNVFGDGGEDGFITRLSGAIYDAVSSAFGDSRGGGGNHTTVFEVNGLEFFRATYNDQQQVAKEHGVSLINT